MPRVGKIPYNKELVATTNGQANTTTPSHTSLGLPWGRGKVSREDYSVALSPQKIEPLGARQQFRSQKAEEATVGLRRMVTPWPVLTYGLGNQQGPMIGL
jgi:hypothetical protein